MLGYRYCWECLMLGCYCWECLLGVCDCWVIIIVGSV
jgi:hypothetical protein